MEFRIWWSWGWTRTTEALYSSLRRSSNEQQLHHVPHEQHVLKTDAGVSRESVPRRPAHGVQLPEPQRAPHLPLRRVPQGSTWQRPGHLVWERLQLLVSQVSAPPRPVHGRIEIFEFSGVARALRRPLSNCWRLRCTPSGCATNACNPRTYHSSNSNLSIPYSCGAYEKSTNRLFPRSCEGLRAVVRPSRMRRSPSEITGSRRGKSGTNFNVSGAVRLMFLLSTKLS